MENDYDWAVCQVSSCGWEGSEDEVEFFGTDGEGDVCPNCGAESVLYFTPASESE